MTIYVIEHLEKNLSEWSLIEYKHISKIVGKENLMFTNTQEKKLRDLGIVGEKTVKELKLQNACVLDPNAKKILVPKDRKKFDYFIFGGILGNDPPEERTKLELTSQLPYPARNLGEKQMSTDTAVAVVKKIIDGVPFEKIKFVDDPVIKMGSNEEIILPYRYLADKKGKAVVAREVIRLLKRNKGF